MTMALLTALPGHAKREIESDETRPGGIAPGFFASPRVKSLQLPIAGVDEINRRELLAERT